MQLFNKIAFITISFTWLNMQAMETPLEEQPLNSMVSATIAISEEYKQGLTILSNISMVEGTSLFKEKLKNLLDDVQESLLSAAHISTLISSDLPDEHLHELLNLKKRLVIDPLINVKKELEILVSSQQYFKKSLSHAGEKTITKFQELAEDMAKMVEEKKKKKRKIETNTRIWINYWHISLTEEEQRYLFSDLLDENNSEITNQLNDLTF